MAKRGDGFGNYTSNLLARAIIKGALLLPYETRVPVVGWIVSRLIAPLVGYNKRVRDNLAYVMPNLSKAEVQQICRETTNNAGRNLIEMYSGAEFKARAARFPLQGEGLADLVQAHDAKRPVILVTGHFGSYDAPRAAMGARGFPVGGIYKPMRNIYFNAHYVAALNDIGAPLFERGRRGLGQMVKFLRGGGMVGFLIDQDQARGGELSFFGKPARTALSAAEMALKYDALMVPVFGIRAANGLDFEFQVQKPIAPSDAQTMTQDFNDRLETLVRAHMGQWFWIHKRWKR